MPTRKQRRRRQKELRHEYEYVYVDDEGHEVEVEDDQPEKVRRNARSNGKATPAKARSARPPRKVDPPSWRRALTRGLLFGVFIFVAFGFISHKDSLAGKLELAVLYTAFFIPFIYLLDRSMYRAYLRRTGNAPPPRQRRRT